jgi:uncharacterized protein with GYD domain
MALYMHQWRYKDEQIRRMLEKRADREQIVKVAVEAFGGQLLSFYYTFGDFDGVAISEFPDPMKALACVLAISAQGRVTSVRTTPLFSAADGLNAMKEAGDAVSG